MGSVIALVLALQAALPMTTIARGANSQIMDARQPVVQNENEWRALWREHAGDASAPPAVDFTRFTVVGLFVGSRSSAGYSVEITSAAARNGETILEYVERQPAADAITAQVITSPFHIVRIAKTAGPVVLRRASQ
jgi:hypothetical protein